VPVRELRFAIHAAGTARGIYRSAAAPVQVLVLDADSTNLGLERAIGCEREPDPLIAYRGGTAFEGGTVTCPVDDPTPLANGRISVAGSQVCFVVAAGTSPISLPQSSSGRLTSYFAYYHESRTHLSLDRNAPLPREVEPPSNSRVIAIPMVGGL
jgi:hypothetical protein